MSNSKIVIYSHSSACSTLISEIVGHSFAKVICCTTAEQVASTCAQQKPDLVIILIIKPFIDGSELIKRIRLYNKRQPPIYVIAWQQSEQFVLSLLECGVDQYMTFPICMSRLRGKTHSQITNTERV